MISYYKGEFISSKNISINENLFYGIGVFETIRFNNKKMIFFEDHMNRLFSNDFFDLSTISKKEIYINSKKLVDKNSINNGLIKIIVLPLSENWNELEYYIFIRELPKIESSSATIIFYDEDKYPILRFNPMHKSLSYMGNFLAKKDAKKDGAFEPIFYNSSKIITEGAIRNIFFIKENMLCTPSTELGILNGITRQKIICIARDEGYKVDESPIEYHKINNMNEAFITSSAIGVLPCNWKGWKSEYTITNKLKNLYKHLVENG